MALSVLGLIALGSTQGGRRVESLTGNIRIIKAFHSAVLGNTRDVILYLPPDYDSSPKRRYPVLYMQDGQNLFDGMTSFIPNQEWQMDETAQRLIREHKIEPLIIVGIYNAGMDRANEYLPTHGESSGNMPAMGGKADLYGRMLTTELIPLVNREYRTKTARSDTGIGGSSLAGILSLHLGLTLPNVFGKIATVSPSVWWDDHLMVRRVDSLPTKVNSRIWLDIGTDEGFSSLPDARLLKEALLRKGWRLGSDLQYMEAVGAHHNEVAWAHRVEPMLEFLFPPK